MENFKITDEQRQNINKLKGKRFIKNDWNREVMLRNFSHNTTLNIQHYAEGLMQGLIYQGKKHSESMQNIALELKNIGTELEKVKKELNRLKNNVKEDVDDGLQH